jgi:squalene-associated FAD-dependent desaturase
MKDGKVYVVGAGLAGLAAAVALAERGVRVELIEAAPQAGGRCRSYFDSQLQQVIDNGNHLVLSGNRATMAYLAAIGAADRLTGPAEARFAFCNVASGARWTIAPSEGPLAWWIFSKARRVPDTNARDYAKLAPLLLGNRGRRIDEVVACEGPLWERLLRPLLLAALNTEPAEASAELASAVMRETLARGGRAYRPRIATPTLAAAFVEPAVALLKRQGVNIRLGERVRAIAFDGGRVAALDLAEGQIAMGAEDRVVLAVPPWAATSLVPGIAVPDSYRAIVNAHYRTAAGSGAEPMVGVIGGVAEWVFAFPDRISVTVSAADGIVDRDRAELAETLWRDVATVHGLSQELPPWQIVKEKRATFAATPQQAVRRAGTATHWTNLFLAGDWTATGLPATIEGAIRSGQKAAELAWPQR